MTTLFLSPSCTSCRKAKAWLKTHKVPFQEHNIMTSPLTRRALGVNGVSDAQAEPVSFGEEKPAVVGTGESAWSQNRRVEIKYR